MHIKQVADLTGLSAKQIRDYEKHQLLPNVHRTLSGYRTYNEQDIERLKFIHHSREVGFSIAQIKELVHLLDTPSPHQCKDVKQFTRLHLQFLTQEIDRLEKMRQTLQQCYDACAGDENAYCVILEHLKN
ncbi:Cu(I)-responsive transcriptional regulator [Moraxella cuniculi DSM 21768]|uniref:Cu(I)-responsive transcriptional regulator n=1 Tax=Moraxella cuniculi DSM 21768 TaxID=1122245 RepID=A0A1N7EZ66_9GAMM|nr:MerR family transcriptional regulator [Moraxella cuniculi]OOS02294.1 Cu(I)-responsive transcriptional regulator [Moraxella cuniculi]SIR93225.1 Cu(I)-responsive transcriptional regulator [Moraxella cuniculi DSM 21768]